MMGYVAQQLILLSNRFLTRGTWHLACLKVCV